MSTHIAQAQFPTATSQTGDVQQAKFLQLNFRNRWEYVSRRSGPDVVAIVAVTKSKELILTEQFRVPLNAYVVDLPAGLVGDESPELAAQAAKRELFEEVGAKSEQLIKSISRPTSPGLTDEMVTYFIAPNCQCVAAGGGVDSETIKVHVIALSDIDNWLSEQESLGKFIDPKVDVAIRIFERSKL